ncbi:MAG: hypothetical protein J2P17_14700, partial [Mycobacterium sp.]|nr:hypothetical protein [Mycobacterium sp.]
MKNPGVTTPVFCVQVPAPPSGLVEVSTLPFSMATQRVSDGHEMDWTFCSTGNRALLMRHAPDGSVEVIRVFPFPTATQSEPGLHATAVISLGTPPVRLSPADWGRNTTGPGVSAKALPVTASKELTRHMHPDTIRRRHRLVGEPTPPPRVATNPTQALHALRVPIDHRPVP